jgi:hypothetical protein
MRQETAALREFNPGYDRLGVIRDVTSSCRSLADFRNALKADAKSGHRHLSRWAKRRHLNRKTPYPPRPRKRT